MTELTFGRYPQDPNAYEGRPRFTPLVRQPIRWIVIAEEESKRLLLSRDVLEYLPFNDFDTFDISWQNSTLRTWLNSEFLLGGNFSEDEKRALLPHPETEDRVFLLSLDEVLQYVPSNRERKCLPTEYAVSRLSQTFRYMQGNPCDWWLRTIGESSDRNTMVITFKGMYNKNGFKNNMRGTGVRPAVWISK